MSDLATLLTAVTGLVTALGGAVVAILTVLRTSPRERKDAAREGVVDVLAELQAAAEDGEITPAEIANILKRQEDGEQS